MFGQTTAFEHIFQLLFSPPAARFGRIAQRVHQPRRYARHPVLPCPHLVDKPRQIAISLGPIALDLAHLLFIRPQFLADRMEQEFQPLLVLLTGLMEAFIGALQERSLRLAKQLLSDLAKLCGERFFCLTQRAQLFLKRTLAFGK